MFFSRAIFPIRIIKSGPPCIYNIQLLNCNKKCKELCLSNYYISHKFSQCASNYQIEKAKDSVQSLSDVSESSKKENAKTKQVTDKDKSINDMLFHNDTIMEEALKIKVSKNDLDSDASKMIEHSNAKSNNKTTKFPDKNSKINSVGITKVKHVKKQNKKSNGKQDKEVLNSKSIIKDAIVNKNITGSKSGKEKNYLAKCSSNEIIVKQTSDVDSMKCESGKEIQYNLVVPEGPSENEIPSKWQRYLFGRYSVYLKKFQNALANEMPDTAKMLEVFANGLKEFIIDFRDLLKVHIQLSLPLKDFEDLSYREIYLYYNMPAHMIRVFPVVALSSLPFGQNFVFPMAYHTFPRQLLSYHFWTPQQKIQFAMDSLTKRLFNSRPVFRYMQDRIQDVTDTNDKETCLLLFYLLGSGINLSKDDIMSLIPIFSDHPFSLDFIYAGHVKSLIRYHNLSIALPRRRYRLKLHARYIHRLDMAIIREGIDKFSSSQLRRMMILRGGNPEKMNDAEVIEYLKDWLSISELLSESSYSLLLHMPIFMAYNLPSNVMLIR